MKSAALTLNSVTPNIAKHPTIKQAGLKGFLLWMKTDPQLSNAYQRIRPSVDKIIGTSPQSNALAGFGDDTVDLSMSDVAVMPVSTPDITDVQASIDNTIASAPTAPAPSSWTSAISGLVSGVSTAFMTANQLATAKAVTDTQLARAKAGLPPLNLNSYGLSTTPGVNVGLSASTQSLVMYGGIALLAVILLPKLLKG